MAKIAIAAGWWWTRITTREDLSTSQVLESKLSFDWREQLLLRVLWILVVLLDWVSTITGSLILWVEDVLGEEDGWTEVTLPVSSDGHITLSSNVLTISASSLIPINIYKNDGNIVESGWVEN